MSAETAPADHQYASFIDVLTSMGLLHNVQAWHNGRVQYLDEMTQGSPEKLLKVIDIFQKWAARRGLRCEDLPPHSSFIRTPPKYHTASQFPVLEQAFRQHFVSPQLPEKKLRSTTMSRLAYQRSSRSAGRSPAMKPPCSETWCTLRKRRPSAAWAWRRRAQRIDLAKLAAYACFAARSPITGNTTFFPW